MIACGDIDKFASELCNSCDDDSPHESEVSAPVAVIWNNTSCILVSACKNFIYYALREVDRVEVVFDLIRIVERTGFSRTTMGETLLLVIIETHGISRSGYSSKIAL